MPAAAEVVGTGADVAGTVVTGAEVGASVVPGLDPLQLKTAGPNRHC